MDHPYTIGQSYLIRLVTHYWLGRLVAVHERELVLENASWIADTGRYHKAVDIDSLVEVEPRKGPIIIGRGALVDCAEWHSALPTDPK